MSQANNPITLKVHHGDDIRRLHLEKLDWEELTQLISSTYPTPYTLKYRDSENDLVTMVAQHDLQDAYEMSQGDHVLHLYVVDKTASSGDVKTSTSTATASAPDVDMKSDDDLASQLSHDEISTLLSECLSDPAMMTAIPPFLTTFIDQLSTNMSHATPLSTSWTQSLQQHPAIRDHVILSVLLPRMEQALARADSNNLATRIPAHVLPMVKGFVPALPMFLPTILPMVTKFMSDTTANTQHQTPAGNPFANSPLTSLLGPMFSGMQQAPSAAASPSSAASTSAATSPSNSSSAAAAPFNPLLGLLGPLLAGAAANPGASTSTTNNNNSTANNPLASLLGPLLAANANNNASQANPLASLLQQFAQPSNDTTITTTTNNNNNNNNNNNPVDYTEQLAIMESMDIGSREVNMALLQQCDGSVERVVQLLAME